MSLQQRHILLAITVLSLLTIGLQSCGSDDPPPPPPPPPIDVNKVTIKGTVAVPETPPDSVVLSSTQHLGAQWLNCYHGNQDSVITGGVFSLETATNCGSDQFVYFYSDSPVDMTTYSNGDIQFKLQVNNQNQGFTFWIQDDLAGLSNQVDLTNFGYDRTKTAVDQLITIPVSALRVATFDLTKVKRFFQIKVTCSASNCFTTLSNIKWRAALQKIEMNNLTEMAEDQARFSAGRTGPRCDPGPCRRLSNAPVRLLRPTSTGWRAEPAVDPVTTNSNGNFTITVDENILLSGGPFFIGVSDSGGMYTLLSTVPTDLAKGGATIELAVDRTTTAASVMHCPGGKFPPSSGGYCWSDPNESATLDTLYVTIDAYFLNSDSTSPDMNDFLSDLLNDPDVLATLNELLGAKGLPSVTAQELLTASQTSQLPIVTSSGSTTPPSGGADLTGTWSGSEINQARGTCGTGLYEQTNRWTGTLKQTGNNVNADFTVVTADWLEVQPPNTPSGQICGRPVGGKGSYTIKMTGTVNGSAISFSFTTSEGASGNVTWTTIQDANTLTYLLSFTDGTSDKITLKRQ